MNQHTRVTRSASQKENVAAAAKVHKDRGIKDHLQPIGKAAESAVAVKGVLAGKQRTALNTITQHPHAATKVVKPRITRSQTAKSVKLGPELKEIAVSKKKKADNAVEDKENDPEEIPAPVSAPAPAKVTKPKAVKTTSEKPTVVPKPAEPPTTKATKSAPSVAVPVLEEQVSATEELWDDLDSDDLHDPMMVAEYVSDIFEYMRQLELTVMPNPKYIDNQKELDWNMRAVLVDWLVDIHTKFRLLPETLYLAVNIIDRFLSLRVVSSIKIQLVGVAAMLIASKYEEVAPPSVKNFIYVTDDGYAEDEILRAERYILSVLDYNLQYPSPMSFLRRSSKAEQYDIQTRTLAKYLMEVSLIDHRFLDIPPSVVAGAGLLLARKMLRRGSWDKNLVHYSGYAEAELNNCVQLTLRHLNTPSALESLTKKYAGKKFMKASVFVKDWMSKNYKSDDEN